MIMLDGTVQNINLCVSAHLYFCAPIRISHNIGVF